MSKDKGDHVYGAGDCFRRVRIDGMRFLWFACCVCLKILFNTRPNYLDFERPLHGAAFPTVITSFLGFSHISIKYFAGKMIIFVQTYFIISANEF